MQSILKQLLTNKKEFKVSTPQYTYNIYFGENSSSKNEGFRDIEIYQEETESTYTLPNGFNINDFESQANKTQFFQNLSNSLDTCIRGIEQKLK